MIGRTALAFALCLIPSFAHADDTAAVCADAANAAQPLRRSGNLRAARVELLRCAQSECPDAIRGRCTSWLAEVDAALPSVVFRARDASGGDVIDLHVAIDGEPVTSPVGVATIVDPGTHHIRYEAPSAGPREEDLVVAQGEKNRVVLLVFPAATPPPEKAPIQVTPTPAPLVSPAVAYGLGALGIVALGTFAALEVKAHHDYDDLQSGCAPTQSCNPSDLHAPRTEGTVAVVFGSVGVVTLAASMIFLLWRPKAPVLSGTF